ncbi:hypothetical protein PR048_018063 [Dryococelus australis]|uniref:Protein kinase domain-containing protein n=1 Tax=Dryococelus australis TaxID=614101 RepID=A0ABQ9HBD0_9NEOP|nr:hypothetical protein PR048_018063 [Dryococelus australis]
MLDTTFSQVKIDNLGPPRVEIGCQHGGHATKEMSFVHVCRYAPESLRDGKFSPRSDVWSYGVTLYEMFSRGEDPQLGGCEQDQQQLLAALEAGTRLPCPPLCPQTVYVQLMTPCWQADTHARPSFPEICAIVQDMRTNMC